MPKFRKKPVVVEAFQMTQERRVDNSEWPDWLHRAWNKERGEPGSLFPAEEGTLDGELMIGTLEGPLLVSWDSVIIQGVQGEIYPCAPDIFEETYDPAGDAEADFEATAKRITEEWMRHLGYTDDEVAKADEYLTDDRAIDINDPAADAISDLSTYSEVVEFVMERLAPDDPTPV